MGQNDPRNDPRTGRVSRRDLLKGSLALGAGAAGAALGSGLSSAAGASIERAMALDAASTDPTLSDVRHVVILMQENRSFDHYFGTLSGVRGFSDPHVLRNGAPGRSGPIFQQYGYQPGVGVDADGYLVPFELEQNFPTQDGATTNDISHEWGTQHASWNGGKMDSFVQAHLQADGVANFVTTMGYFTRADLPYYHALADAFTICDRYHCSVLGPTDPNRVMALSGTIDPTGAGGGPVLVTQTTGRPQQYGTFSWTTMPEQLLDAGVTWKVYNDPTGLALFNPLPYFKAYNDPTTSRGLELHAPRHRADVPGRPRRRRGGRHPAPGELDPRPRRAVRAPRHRTAVGREPRPDRARHPHLEPRGVGPHAVHPPLRRERRVLRPRGSPDAGTGHGGRVPHHEPPPRRRRTATAGPVGLGFRVPCLLMSPFTRGGFVATDVFDHTSTLRLVETLFGVPVPNLSAWRRGVTGDLTERAGAGQPADPTIPPLPDASLVEPLVDEQVILNALTGTFDEGVAYPPPAQNQMPVQETTPTRPKLP